MKKLLPLFFACWWKILLSQNAGMQNSFAIIGGVNWLYQFSDSYVNASFLPRVGYSTGFECTFEILKKWHFKGGFRYAELNYNLVAGPFYDPALPLYVSLIKHYGVCQFSAGIRWLSKPGTWRYYLDAETGLSNFVESEEKWKGKMIATISAGLGIECRVRQSKTAAFLQPVVRYISRDFRGDRVLNLGHHFLNPGVEFGIRNNF